mmetsp:Transcript_17361/g.54578  ORF Transcript_17361/g.54578 Transcript_17361/m.54578 type:complete len:353 (-) Transcript_17361:1062-2120(-)
MRRAHHIPLARRQGAFPRRLASKSHASVPVILLPRRSNLQERPLQRQVEMPLGVVRSTLGPSHSFRCGIRTSRVRENTVRWLGSRAGSQPASQPAWVRPQRGPAASDDYRRLCWWGDHNAGAGRQHRGGSAPALALLEGARCRVLEVLRVAAHAAVHLLGRGPTVAPPEADLAVAPAVIIEGPLVGALPPRLGRDLDGDRLPKPRGGCRVQLQPAFHRPGHQHAGGRDRCLEPLRVHQCRGGDPRRRRDARVEVEGQGVAAGGGVKRLAREAPSDRRGEGAGQVAQPEDRGVACLRARKGSAAISRLAGAPGRELRGARLALLALLAEVLPLPVRPADPGFFRLGGQARDKV